MASSGHHPNKFAETRNPHRRRRDRRVRLTPAAVTRPWQFTGVYRPRRPPRGARRARCWSQATPTPERPGRCPRPTSRQRRRKPRNANGRGNSWRSRPPTSARAATELSARPPTRCRTRVITARSANDGSGPALVVLPGHLCRCSARTQGHRRQRAADLRGVRRRRDILWHRLRRSEHAARASGRSMIAEIQRPARFSPLASSRTVTTAAWSLVPVGRLRTGLYLPDR